MPSFALIGGSFEILDTPHCGDLHLQKCALGGVFEMSEELARHAVLNHAALVPLATFEGFGFTAEELKQYPNARMQDQASHEFKLKLARALQAFHEYRAQLAQER